MLGFNEPRTKQDVHYYLTCKVKILPVTYEDYQSKGNMGQVTEDMVFLIPQESDQRSLFYNAWLPETLEENFEIGISMGHPIFGVFRATVRRFHPSLREPHIFVMTRSAEEIFKYIKDKTIKVDVLPQDDELMLDAQADFELNLKK